MEFLSQTATTVTGFSGGWTGWVAPFLKLVTEGRVDAALKELSITTTRLKNANTFEQLNNGLKQIEFALLPDVVLAGLLRNVFSVREQLEDWDSLVGLAEQLLEGRNSNSRALLRGLKP